VVALEQVYVLLGDVSAQAQEAGDVVCIRDPALEPHEGLGATEGGDVAVSGSRGVPG